MQRNEAEKNIEQPKIEQLTLNLGLTEEKSNKRFHSKYHALLSLLPEKTNEEYIVEISIIKKIIKLGFKAIHIYGAWNYYKTRRNQEFNSFKIFLWKKGKLIFDILPLLQEEKSLNTRIDENKDFRTNKDVLKETTKKSLMDFLGDESRSN